MIRFLFKPRWLLFTLVVAAAAVAMVKLGQWQLRRLDERRAFNTMVTERLLADPVPLDPAWVGPTADVEAARFRVVRVRGEYGLQTDTFPAPQSYQLISTLTTTDGRSLVVNRGAIPVTADVPPIPTAEIDLIARIERVPINANAGGSATWLVAMSSDPSDAAGITALPPPELSEGSHLSYALQWFAFSACVVVGWCLMVRRGVRSRRTGLAGLRPSQKAVPWRD